MREFVRSVEFTPMAAPDLRLYEMEAFIQRLIVQTFGITQQEMTRVALMGRPQPARVRQLLDDQTGGPIIPGRSLYWPLTDGEVHDTRSPLAAPTTAG